MKGFRKRRRGGIVGTFEGPEAALLANLVGQVVELLRDRNGESESSADPLATMIGMAGPMTPPDDPVLARLLPDAYRDAPDDATEFRRFTEQTLSSAKVANAEVVLAALAAGGLGADGPGEDASGDHVEVELDEAQGWAWLKALTDVRLAFATRIGIETEEDLEHMLASDDEAAIAMADIYDWLGYVQESLVHALDS